MFAEEPPAGAEGPPVGAAVGAEKGALVGLEGRMADAFPVPQRRRRIAASRGRAAVELPRSGRV